MKMDTEDKTLVLKGLTVKWAESMIYSNMRI